MMASDKKASAPEPNGSLEGRLRDLILANTSSEVDHSSFPRLGQSPSQESPPQSSHQDLSEYKSAEAKATAANGSGNSNPGSPKATRKRPNQAQRRQMSAQLSIPIDPRPLPPVGPHSARPYVSPPAHAGPQHHHYQHRQQLSGSFQRNAHSRTSSTYDPHGPPSSSWSSQASGPHQYGSLSIAPPHHHVPHHHYNPSGGYHPDGTAPPTPAYHQDRSSPRAARPSPQGNLFSHRRQHPVRSEELAEQAAILEGLCRRVVADAEIQRDEIAEKEAFRVRVEQICREVIGQYEASHNGIQHLPSDSVALKCFGSLSSGFATKESDMDLGLLSPLSPIQPDAPGSPIPRLLEGEFLRHGLGARLLTRTRVPIIKLCEKPSEKLYRDLVEEREKWESGRDEHMDGAEEETEALAEASADNARFENTTVDPEAGLEVPPLPPVTLSREKQLASLRQSASNSLSAYHTMAKRVLRRLGGRDITISNHRDFKPEDFELLNEVCRAFVRGLHNHELRTRLEGYQSLNAWDRSDPPSHRSLLGVFTQAEGERIIMLWEQRRIHDRSSELRDHAEDFTRAWKSLQDKATFGVDPVLYTKELQLALLKLTRPASVQLVTLEQGCHESPTAYHFRASRLQADLDSSETSHSETVRAAVVRHYASGIHHWSIRRAVQEFIDSLQETPSLRTVARRHKSLHLAFEFERAVEKGLYTPDQTDLVTNYVAILKQPLRKSHSSDPNYDHVVGITGHTSALVKAAKHLPDPSRMTPNRPRDPYHDRLQFPKIGVGVQCDINFSAHLALQNTLLLRCYSLTDPRVRPLVLFVKHWAKARGINSGYRGTLSSYGYVLMMLHYLVNIAQPFVCPNLQKLAPVPQPNSPSAGTQDVCNGVNVSFWRDEEEIRQLAESQQLNMNRDSIGHLLRGFFEYYAQSGMMSTAPHRGFDWGREVLSLRTTGGLLTKQEKGWVGARTVLEIQPEFDPSHGLGALSDATRDAPAQADDMAKQRPSLSTQASELSIPDASDPPHRPPKSSEVKEIRHRYLFAIEDPFELDHNVARTVTHNGIVAIRDEFRRAWRIIRNPTAGQEREDLLEDVTAEKEAADAQPYLKLMEELHGWELFD